MTTIDNPNRSRSAIIQGIARRFIERSTALQYKGTKRDNAALDFFCGAACAFEEAGEPDLAQYIGRVAVFNISTRGFFAVNEIATRANA